MIEIKRAETPSEFEQISRFNHETFVEEIPQHAPRQDQQLVDQFHHKNQYLIAMKDGVLLGMICYNGKRPFSLDQKISNLNNYLPPNENHVELRLLAVKKETRKGIILYKILSHLAVCLLEDGFTYAIISATTREIMLYKKIGFTPFADLVGKEGAMYQPMYITFKKLRNGLQPH